MTKADAERKVAQLNDRLKESSVPVRVRLNGSVLGLRATLPLKVGTGRKQQDLRMGIPATKDGFKRIEAEAHQLAQRMVSSTFNWLDYTPESKRPDKMPISQLIQNFKVEYLRSHQSQDSTWKHWQRTFDKLPQDEPLTEVLLIAAAQSCQPNTNARQRDCQHLQALAVFAGVKVDLKSYQGNYGRSSVKPRDLPGDELILEWQGLILNPDWQWVYGMMAAFGLRPHECFHVNFVEPDVVDVWRSKTYPHRAYAVLPEWALRWNLIDVKLPGVAPNQDLRIYGDRTKKQFTRYKVPFKAYDLRHAYAIRGSVVEGHSVGFMAASMGHSEAEHMKTYHRWLSNKTNEQIYQEYKRSRDRS